MTNEPNQTDADDSDETSEDPIDGANAQGAATAPSPVAGGDADDEPDEELAADEGPSVPSPSETDADETDDAGEAEDAEAESLAEETSDPGLAEETSDPGLAEESSEAQEAEADDEDPSAESQAPDNSLDLPEFVDLHEQGAEWLAGLFERMHFDAEAEVFDEDGDPRVDISGPDADRLLGAGKLGPKAIEGIETLMQSVFSEDDDASDLYVDVGNQRAERKEMLQRVAADLADRAVDLHKTVTVSGLNSTERRIIHRRLRDYDGVDTESVGDGIFRRLKIEPTS